MMKIHKSQRVGITETSEIAFNLDVFDNLYKANIIITKRLTNDLINKLNEHYDKVILHLTCTGMGQTRIEPFVPSVDETREKFIQLITLGFPIEQVVLRIDPIVPTDKGIRTATSVLEAFKGLGIKRVRISFLDNYKHVRERFKNEGINELYDGSFHAPLEDRVRYLEMIKDCASECGYEVVEACGEPGIESTPCLSQRDIDTLCLTDEIKLVGSAEQRTSCSCPQNKSELITNGFNKKCKHGCLYCYVKDNKK